MYSQLLIAASLLIAGYQDVRVRSVLDIVWIPAIAGAVLVFVLAPFISIQLAIRLALVGGVSFAFAKYGSIGQADAIALVAVSADPSPLTPIPMLLATGVIAMLHTGALYAKGFIGKSRTIKIDQFRREARWIPKAIIKGGVRTEVERDVNVSRESVESSADEGAEVEVQYGVPTVTYIGLGYLAYLIYLVLFQPGLLFGLA